MLALVLCNHDLLKCGIVILLPPVQLRINLCLKFKNPKMEKFVSKINSVMASTAKPLGESPPGNKNLGIEPVIRCYEI